LLMVDNAQWVEWFVEKATAGRNLGSTAWAPGLNRLVLLSFLPPQSSQGISTRAVVAKQPGVCNSQMQKSRNSAP
jgi:hypothetical protein